MRPSATTAGQTLRDRLIADAEIEAERTVAILRTLMASGLLVLLVLALAGLDAPSPERVHRQAGMAVAVLVAYLVLGFLSWRLARPGVLRPWMPWLFTTADAGLILFNVAFNADNMALPVAFAPAFPVVWLAPLVLSFTVLRYRPALQAYAGALIVGGLIVVGWMGGADPGAAVPPAASFALPPNLMRLGMFAGLVVILVVAARRRRRLLTRAIAEAEQRVEYQRYLPPAIADLVARGEIDRLRRGWRTRAAVLLLDIRGFTTLAESLDAAALGRFVTTFRRQVSEIVEAEGGIIDKFVGDGAVILFGVLDDDPGAARKALACAEQLVHRIREIEGYPVQLAVGAHWGEVFAGAVGDEDRLEFTVLGDTVNVAARLEEICKQNGTALVASQALVNAAGATGRPVWTALPMTTLRGRSGALRVLAFERTAGVG